VVVVGLSVVVVAVVVVVFVVFYFCYCCCCVVAVVVVVAIVVVVFFIDVDVVVVYCVFTKVFRIAAQRACADELLRSEKAVEAAENVSLALKTVCDVNNNRNHDVNILYFLGS